MTLQWVAALSIAAGALCSALALLTLRRVRRQLMEMARALEDVKNGNGNRRVLAAPRELAAPVAYAVNDIVLSYEDRLSAYRRTEETNKQLMTSLSHDVRTPLTTLIGYLDAAHRGIVEGEERERYLETARRKAHDLKEYIDVLFDWFKLGSGEWGMQPVPVEAAELTRELLIDWVPVLEEKGIDYAVEIPEQPFRTNLDADAYARIVGNIIQNVIAHSQATCIGVRMTREGGDMVLRLCDDGVGIAKEDLAHIFERLYKCDKGRSRKGSGLGLAIARELARSMGGEISAASEPGSGTTFALRFPLIS